MGSLLVVVDTPRLDCPARVVETHEPVTVQALISKATIETLHHCILDRLARIDVVQYDPVLVCPLIEPDAREFWTVVQRDPLRSLPGLDNPVEQPR